MALDEAYREFVAACPGATLWQDADFLECFGLEVPGASWEYVSFRQNEKLVAVLPYYRKPRLDGWVIVMPAPLRYVGPVMDAAWQRTVGFAEAYRLLLAKVPEGYRSFDQTWVPQHELGDFDLASTGYSISERPTYLANLRGGPKALALLPSKSMRRRLRKAANYWMVREQPLTTEAIAIMNATLDRKGVAVGYEPEALISALSKIGSRAAAHHAYTPSGELQAVAVVVADAQTAYCWLNGSVAAAKDFDGGSYLLMQNLQWAQARGCQVGDFVGSALPGPAENRRRLGGVLNSYYHVYRDAAWWTKRLRWWRGRA